MNVKQRYCTNARKMAFATGCICLAAIQIVHSQNIAAKDEAFQAGRYESFFGATCLFSPFVAVNGRPEVNYALAEVQLGYMLSDVKGTNFCRGNWEIAAAGFYGPVFEGEGNYVTGTTLWLRYNFVPGKSRFTPYLQAGAGLGFTDIDRELLGQDFNFNLGLGAGTRYFLSAHWSVNLEYRFQHISNANLSNHNVGVNAHGPLLAFSYLF